MVPGPSHSGGGEICADVQKYLNPCTNLKTVNHYDNNKHVTEVTRKGIRKITTFSLQHVGTFHLPNTYQMVASNALQSNVLATEVARAPDTTPT
jgi:hypothetical protein